MKSKRRILVVKVGAIGDVALSLCILQAFQKDEVTWIVGKDASSLLKATLDNGHLLILNEVNLLKGNIALKIWEVLKAWKKLFFKKFDLVITAHPDPRYRVLSLLSFKKEHRYFIKGKNAFPVSGIFHGLCYLELAYGNSTCRKIIWPKLTLPSLQHLIEPSQHEPIIILSPGGCKDHLEKKLRMWPVEYYVQLAQGLQKHKCQVVLVGMLQDEWVLTYFKGLEVINLIGKTTILELIALFEKTLGVVTHDGGALHLARLVHCKLCSIFGPTSPKDFSLESEDEIVFWGGIGLNCRPCYNGKSFAKCSHQSCMKQIKPEIVLETITNKWSLKKREDSNCS